MAMILDANCHVAALDLISIVMHFCDRLFLLKSVRYPVGNERGDAPFPRMSRYGIEVLISPASLFSMSSCYPSTSV